MGNVNLLDTLKALIKKNPKLYTFALKILYPVLATGRPPQYIFDFIPDNYMILNLGSGPTNISHRVVNVDIYHYPNVHVIADVHNLPFETGSVGGVISIAMLEHVKNPSTVVAEMYRVLKPGGYVYAIVPFIFGFHSAPNDYYRWTMSGVQSLFASFKTVEIGIASGPTSSLLIILHEWLAMFFSFQNRYLYQLLYLVFMVLLSPFKIIDYYLCRHPEAHKIASTLYFIGEK